MPVDEDVFAFRLRQSDDFACSVNWNQKTSLSKIREIESVRCDRAQVADAGEIQRGDADVRSRDNLQPISHADRMDGCTRKAA